MNKCNTKSNEKNIKSKKHSKAYVNCLHNHNSKESFKFLTMNEFSGNGREFVSKTMAIKNIIILFICFGYIYDVNGHISLDFPPARDLRLDFLDTFRTHAPCGMPKQESMVSLVAGNTINVTWHLGYPHQGGFYIDLLDSEENILQSLTPGDGGSKRDGWIDDDTTAQSYPLTIPSDIECINCTIRIQRQAIECGKKYKFWSCADVDIVSSTDNKNICLGGGNYNPSFKSCFCPKNRHGSQCQYEIECLIDADCMNGGKCIDIMSTRKATKRQCFCPDGHFGSKCELSSTIGRKDILDLSQGYESRKISENVKLFWRINQTKDCCRLFLQ